MLDDKALKKGWEEASDPDRRQALRFALRAAVPESADMRAFFTARASPSYKHMFGKEGFYDTLAHSYFDSVRKAVGDVANLPALAKAAASSEKIRDMILRRLPLGLAVMKVARENVLFMLASAPASEDLTAFKATDEFIENRLEPEIYREISAFLRLEDPADLEGQVREYAGRLQDPNYIATIEGYEILCPLDPQEWAEKLASRPVQTYDREPS